MNARVEQRTGCWLVLAWLLIGGTSAFGQDAPRIALVVRGDPVITGPLARELDGRLGDAGFDVHDVRGVLQPADATASFAELAPRLGDRGDLLVAVDVVRLGERQLSYLGREERLFSAHLELRTFVLPDGRALGATWDEEIEYTQATVAVKAERCCAGLMNELAPALRAAWDDELARRAAAAAAAAAREAAERKAAEERAAQAQRDKAKQLPEVTALEAYEAGDYARAAALWDDACGGGEVIACYNLGLLYLDGAAGVARDPRRAARLFQQACDGGEAAGCFNLGAMYDSGEGISRDPHQAAALFRQACQGGAEAACFNLGLLFFTGSGVLPRDLGKAGELFGQACDGGYAPGCFNLGTLYANGDGGLPRDERRAVELFQRACEGGEELGCAQWDLLCTREPSLCE